MKKLKSATGKWVVGEGFFNRDKELSLLQTRVEDGNHVLLTGRRRMGKTSIAKKLSRRLEAKGWACLFVDVEDAKCPEDLIAELAEAGHPVRRMLTRFSEGLKNLIPEKLEEISAYDFKLRLRAGLDAGTWKSRGDELFASFANHQKPVLLVIDELPIFLTRLLRNDDGAVEVENFLSWLRRQLQTHADGALVVLVSGSIGLGPLVRRLGLSDRINHLEPHFASALGMNQPAVIALSR